MLADEAILKRTMLQMLGVIVGLSFAAVVVSFSRLG